MEGIKGKSQRQVRDSNPCTLARSRFRDGRLTTWLTWHQVLNFQGNKANPLLEKLRFFYRYQKVRH